MYTLLTSLMPHSYWSWQEEERVADLKVCRSNTRMY